MSHPLRIALLGAAHSMHTARWANGLHERGHDVHLISLDEPSPAIAPTVHQYQLFCRFPLGYVLTARALRRLLDDIQPDLLNTHDAANYGLLARESGYLPNLLSAWGSNVYEFPTKSHWHRRVLSRNLARATAVGAASHAMANKVRTLAETSVFVTPLGIDETPFPSKTETADADHIVIGTIKTLDAPSGIDTLIRAFAKLKTRLDGRRVAAATRLTLRIYGGSQSSMLTAMVERLGLKHCVEFKGEITRHELPAALDGLDIYVALGRCDSAGVAILGACASGKPVVVAEADSPAEVVVDGVTGFVIPIEDADAAAKRLETLALSAPLRSAMGSAGHMWVRDRYPWDQSLDLMLSAYRETLRIHRDAQMHGAGCPI